MNLNNKYFTTLKPWEKYLIVFGLALLIHAGYFVSAGTNMPLQGDALQYNALAEQVLRGGEWKIGNNYASRAPLITLEILAVYFLFGLKIIAVRWSLLILSCLGAPLLLLLTAKLQPESNKIPWLVAIAWSLYPPALYYSPLLLTESPAALLLIFSAAFFILAAQKNHKLFAFTTGICLALSSLNRPVFLLLPATLFITQIILSALLNIRLKLNFKLWAFCFLGFIVTLSPWITRNYLVLGKFVPGTTLGGIVLTSCNATLCHPQIQFGGYYHNPNIRPKLAALPETEQFSQGLNIVKAEIKKHYRYLPKALFYRVIHFWSPRPNPYDRNWDKNDSLMAIIFLPILFFFLYSFRVWSWKNDWPLLIMIAYAFLFSLPFWGASRFRLPVDAFIIMRAIIAFALILPKKNRSGVEVGIAK